MAVSDVNICNSALNMIGASNILDLTEDSKTGRICNQRYEFVRDAVMRAHPWNCLIQRTSLAPLLSATLSLDSVCIMAYFAFSRISSNLQFLDLLNGRVSMIFTVSPIPQSFFSS